MTQTRELEQVYIQIAALKTNLDDLRSTYKGVSRSYAIALNTLNDLTLHSSEAAKRAAKSTEQSRIAAMNAMLAAKEASGNPALMAVVESAVTAAVAAALAAVESATAAAASAVAHQAEESLLKASSEAANASRMAADSAAEAVKLSNQAREVADLIRGKA
ncbi:hypothetical protein ICN48_08785 [Polynucleobacter sp. JS-Safj-400b-B2]|uniref:hypothetical protein n=1 Tax=Polynucleobacter sp. JS-Safj-400b-B2 TaxID=2576921 RepID=UPI001C0CD406|nr:hypothetical protein [Polynucleobacter sp. JS-Safj-400b-B2]MBU3626329.1 hypothetical protein [Polynucleobacter sp. JS-Safj-400b-B2]